MVRLKKALNLSIAVLMVAGMIGFAGCSGVSEEQMAELQALRQEVSALDSETQDLKNEKSRLEREIAELNAKLEQCAKDKEQTKANLEKMGM
ncbi:MAG TPA: hypothetical protein ENN33_05160 [Ignavibacteria bacterium]|mgnify:CR=1 FL=1|nr:hypothetical protein [Ignavibacteria bacterium]